MRHQISIHAPREGSDAIQLAQIQQEEHFYPRSPRGERPCGQCIGCRIRHFYPRSPRGERHQNVGNPAILPTFLSTLPARGATKQYTSTVDTGRHFYPRSPRGERLGVYMSAASGDMISIHAPREGSDPVLYHLSYWSTNFYPRSPRGERQWTTDILTQAAAFLSTLPARGATNVRQADFMAARISIHAPREGSDHRHEADQQAGMEFLSTLPARGATTTRLTTSPETAFLSTLPARGATQEPRVQAGI